MGVPRLFPWLLAMFPKAVIHFQQGEYILQLDNLYLDANALLHSAAQINFNYGQYKRMMDPNADLSYAQKLVKTFATFFEMIKQTTRIVVPKKLLYIAIDGPAPLAKQAQQRQRRFVSASTRKETDFDSSSITPGTLFMLELTKYMHFMIRKEIARGGEWADINIIFSPPTVPGEGEHKIMDFIRAIPDAYDQSHCIFGPDGDLVMLTLAAHLPKMYLFREDQFRPGYFHILNMGYVRLNLVRTLGQTPGVAKKSRDLNDVTNDFILAGFFVGNDFLPKIQMFMFLEQGLELMISTYASTSKGGTQNVLTNGNQINRQGFLAFVSYLATGEERLILEQAKITPVDPRFKNETLIKNVLDFKGYRSAYYAKAGALDEQSIKRLCKDFLRSTTWVYLYYVSGLPSWKDYYPWHYAPLMVDLTNTLKEMTPLEFESLHIFEKGVASVPFVQLLCVLPPASKNLLPPPFRPLFTDPQSPLVKAGYYPETFEIDYEGKIKEFMGVALLPFVNVDVVQAAYQPIADSLRKTYVRNSVGRNERFVYDPLYEANYRSDYGKITSMHVRKLFDV